MNSFVWDTSTGEGGGGGGGWLMIFNIQCEPPPRVTKPQVHVLTRGKSIRLDFERPRFESQLDLKFFPILPCTWKSTCMTGLGIVNYRTHGM